MTVLGDGHHPLCQQLLDQGVDFILVCREDSHITLYDHLEGIDLPTVTSQHWTGKVQETWSTTSAMASSIWPPSWPP